MPANFPYFLSAEAEREAPHLRRNWYWFLILGVVLMLLGFAAIAYPVAATLATVEIVGVFLLLAAGAEFATAVWSDGGLLSNARKVRNFFSGRGPWAG